MKSKTLDQQAIIKELKQQYQDSLLTNTMLDARSWEEKEGVLITGRMAKAIIDLLSERSTDNQS